LLIVGCNVLGTVAADHLEYFGELFLLKVESQGHADVDEIVLEDKSEVTLIVALVSLLRGHIHFFELLSVLRH
jgi:hypothetical protein